MSNINDLKNRVISLITHIPDISLVEICPSVFSDNIETHDCDNCPMSKTNMGDTFDSAVCLKCWEDAVNDF